MLHSARVPGLVASVLFAVTTLFSTAAIQAADFRATAPRATVIEVPADFPTIQAAIAAASPGDTVRVAPGVYAEAIDFLGKAITVESLAGPQTTMIDGELEPGRYVVTISGVESIARLRGFTVTGGFAAGTGNNFTGPGGGLLINESTAELDNLVVTGNQGVIGGGLLIDDSAVTITEVEFSDNFALFGGAIRVEGGNLDISGSSFSANQAQTDGGAMSVFWANQIDITDTVFEGNAAHGIGAALAIFNTVLTGTDLRFFNNGEATPSGHPPGTGVNYAPLVAGAIYTSNVAGHLDRVRMQGNAAFRGAAYYAAGNSNLVLSNALIEGNQAGTGVVFINGSSPVLINTTLVDNDGFGIFTTFGAQPLLANSIVSGHSSIAAQEIGGNGQVNVEFSLINGSFNSVVPGEGLILDEPPMLDPAADFAPLPGSPVIDAGNNLLLPESVELDLLGNPRFVDDPDAPDTGVGSGAIVDMGAVERQIDNTPPEQPGLGHSARPAPRPGKGPHSDDDEGNP